MAINRPDLAYDKIATADGHYRGKVTDAKPENFLTVTLKAVSPGTVIQMIMSGSAIGQFYYLLVEANEAAKDLCNSTHAFDNPKWTPIQASALFEVPGGTASKDMTFRLRLVQGNFTGDYDIYNVNIIARIL